MARQYLSETGNSGAALSLCGQYRYTLDRTLPEGNGQVNWIMLNPSTADADNDDRTISKITRFTRDWGYRSLVVTNLFALRSTSRARVRKARDPIGPENDGFIVSCAFEADLVVCAWGNDGGYLARNRDVLELLRKLGVVPHALRLTKTGHPEHPLYLPGHLKPFPLEVRP